MKTLSSSTRRWVCFALATMLMAGLLVAVAGLAGCKKTAGEATTASTKAEDDLMTPAYAPKEGQGLDRDIARTSRNRSDMRAREGAEESAPAESAAGESDSAPPSDPSSWEYMDPASLDTQPSDTGNPGIAITMKDGRQIVVELFPDKAPKTVASFTKQVEDGYHDGMFFHRSDDMCIQGGNGELAGKGPKPNVKREITGLPFVAGSFGLARAQAPDSGSTQYFICKIEAKSLDSEYCNFGQTLKGMDIVVGMPARALGEQGPPEGDAYVIKSVRMVRFEEE